MIKSSGEEKILEYLTEILPAVRIDTQYYINYKGIKLYFDFYIKSYKLVIEVQGLQHYEFVEFFHGDSAGWRAHRNRDALKYEWADSEGMVILEINDKNFPKNPNEMLDMLIEVMDE